MPIGLHRGLFLPFKPTHTATPLKYAPEKSTFCDWEYQSKKKKEEKEKNVSYYLFDTLSEVLFAFKETLAEN